MALEHVAGGSGESLSRVASRARFGLAPCHTSGLSDAGNMPAWKKRYDAGIPAPPDGVAALAGAALNGIFGRRFSQGVVSVIACGAAGLSMGFALLSAWIFSVSPGQPEPFVHRYFTWIQAGILRADYAYYYDRLTLVHDLDGHGGRFPDSPLLARVHGA